MIYVFQCPKCGENRQENVAIAERDTAVITCEQCNERMARVFNGKVNFHMKGWGWTGRDYKEKRARDQHSIDMALKQHERYGGGAKLVPNYNGQEADTWEQVREQAVLEKGTVVAPQYTDLIQQERQGPLSRSAVIDKTINDMK